MHLCSPSTSTMYDRFRLAYLLRVESLELSCWWSPRSWESACTVRGWMSPQTPTEGYNSVRYRIISLQDCISERNPCSAKYLHPRAKLFYNYINQPLINKFP